MYWNSTSKLRSYRALQTVTLFRHIIQSSLDDYYCSLGLFWPTRVITKIEIDVFNLYHLYSTFLNYLMFLDVIYNLYINPVFLCLDLVIMEHPQRVPHDSPVTLQKRNQGWVSHQTQLCDSQVFRRIPEVR